ncbi:hypothetical protein MIR68_000648 [Amoeboaphelidium protococcarum]|nr:hypothetical protein MIR68_000648 [Amoeboaphelidium protococcarum]
MNNQARTIVSRALRMPMARRTYTDDGAISASNTSFGKRGRAQEEAYSHQRDLEKLQQLREKLKKAQKELDDHTEEVIKNATKNKK